MAGPRIAKEMRGGDGGFTLPAMADFFEQQAKSLYCLGEPICSSPSRSRL
jgi:hypothetical protein